MLYWTRAPCIRIIIAFTTGIFIQYHADIRFGMLISFFSISFATLIIFRLAAKKNRFRKYNLIVSFLVFTSVLFMGGVILHVKDPCNDSAHVTQVHPDFDFYQAMIKSAPDTSGKYCRVLVEIISVRNKNGWTESSGRALVYLPKAIRLGYRDHLLIKGHPERIEPPLNPDEFNYQRFMQVKGIYFQHFVREGAFIITDRHRGFSFYGLALSARDRITMHIYRYIRDARTRDIMLALLTGQRNYMDRETYAIFIDTGIVHTLAVSGLHVGIIYIFLLMLSKPLYHSRWSKILSLGIKIAVLIFFAFLTGLSPSVLRATLMFISLLTGKIFDRNANALNSISLSAIMILCIDPFTLFEAGFQLSYGAVTGILLFQPHLSRILSSRFQVVDRILQLVSVSIAAQTGTLPFSLYLFHRFPVYFLIGNIFAIPYVTVALVSGGVMLLVSPFAFLSIWIARWLELLTSIFLSIMAVIQSLPHGTLAPVYIDRTQQFLMVALIFSIFQLINTRRWKMLYLSFILLSGIIGSDICSKLKYSNDKKLILYHIPYSRCLEVVNGRNGLLIAQEWTEKQKERVIYNTKNHMARERRKTEMIPLDIFKTRIPTRIYKGLIIFVWNGKTIAILNNRSGMKYLPHIPMEFLIISHNAMKPENIPELHPDLRGIIWDSSNNRMMLNGTDFFDNGNRIGTMTHFVPKHGAFEIILK